MSSYLMDLYRKLALYVDVYPLTDLKNEYAIIYQVSLI